MGSRQYLLGKKFSRWTVLRDGSPCFCRCECGIERDVPRQSLMGGSSKSCGCLKIERASETGRAKAFDLTGRRFGRLIVLSNSLWCDCVCDCGTSAKVRRSQLLDDRTNSCGCLRRESTSLRSATHRMTGKPEYQAWQNAKNRCERPADIRFADYGGRGIQMKFQAFEAFFAEIGPRPEGCSLDRINPDGHYEPGNVRWATIKTQSRNKRTSVMVEIDGVTRNLKEWCEIYGQKYKLVWERMKDGVDALTALTRPLSPRSARRTAVIVESM